MSMKNWKEAYVNGVEKYTQERDSLDEAIEKKRKTIERANNSIEKLNQKKVKVKCPSWINMLVQPLAESLSKEFGMEYEIYGPFGLRNQISIYWREDMSKSIVDQPVKALTLIPGDLDKAELKYETGEVKEGVNLHPDSIGAVNGFNRETLPLPESLEEIKAIIYSLEEKND